MSGPSIREVFFVSKHRFDSVFVLNS